MLKADKTEETFYLLLRQWQDHCRKIAIRVSSSSRAITDCPAYQALVALGYAIIPLIRKEFEDDGSDDMGITIIRNRGFTMLIKDIAGNDFQIPGSMMGKMSEIHDFTRQWLAEHMISKEQVIIFGAEVFREIGLDCDCCVKVMKSNVLVHAQNEQEARELIASNIDGVIKIIQISEIARANNVTYLKSTAISNEGVVVWSGAHNDEALQQYRE